MTRKGKDDDWITAGRVNAIFKYLPRKRQSIMTLWLKAMTAKLDDPNELNLYMEAAHASLAAAKLNLDNDFTAWWLIEFIMLHFTRQRLC